MGDTITRQDTPPCVVCGHCFSEKHRIIPGASGGTYTSTNILNLCPNHHAAWHFSFEIDSEWRRGGAAVVKSDRMLAYRRDESFAALCDAVFPIVHAHLDYRRRHGAPRGAALSDQYNQLDRALVAWFNEHSAIREW